MKPKRKITERDYLFANRRAAREEEIRAHGKQITFRGVVHKVKKAYDRKRLKELLKKEVNENV